MALYVENTENDKITEWHVGGEKLSHLIMPQFVVSVQADGDELLYISRWIDGIRFNRRANVNIWTGADAVFIVNNLD